MPYISQDEFYEDYRKVEVKVLGGPLNKVFPNLATATKETAYKTYTDAFTRCVTAHPDGHPMLPMQIFGRWVKQYEVYVDIFKANGVPPPPELLRGIGKKEDENFKAFNAGDQWNLALNYAWLLGGVHGMQEFYAATPITWDNILCETHILTVTGRELVGLALADYQEIQTELGTGYRLKSGSELQLMNLTLVKYDEEVSKLKNEAEILHFFASKTNWKIG